MYVKALWHKYFYQVAAYCWLNTLPFVFLTISAIFAPVSTAWRNTSIITNSVMIFQELYQIKVDGALYFQSLWQWLDIFGLVSYVIYQVEHFNKGIEAYNDEFTRVCLIIAMITFGLRTITQLRVFVDLCALIELIKQTLLDLIPFLTILFLNVILMSLIAVITTGISDKNSQFKTFL